MSDTQKNRIKLINSPDQVQIKRPGLFEKLAPYDWYVREDGEAATVVHISITQEVTMVELVDRLERIEQFPYDYTPVPLTHLGAGAVAAVAEKVDDLDERWARVIRQYGHKDFLN